MSIDLLKMNRQNIIIIMELRALLPSQQVDICDQNNLTFYSIVEQDKVGHTKG